MKYTVYWTSSYPVDICTQHGTYDTQDEAFASICDWWDQNDFVPRYIRMWTTGDTMHIDYGLHYSFYKIVEHNVDVL